MPATPSATVATSTIHKQAFTTSKAVTITPSGEGSSMRMGMLAPEQECLIGGKTGVDIALGLGGGFFIEWD